MLSALIINGRRIPKATVNPHIVFIDSKALVYEQARNAINGPIDRSTPKRDTPAVPIVCYVFRQSGTRGCTTPSCPAGTVTLLPKHITSAFSYKHTVARARLCTLMRAYWTTIDTDQIPKILRQPETHVPPHRDACCTWCRPTKYSRTLRLRRSARAPIIAGMQTPRRMDAYLPRATRYLL